MDRLRRHHRPGRFYAPLFKDARARPQPDLVFFPKSEITKGLKYIDARGGSNPLVIVVKSKTDEPLSSKTNIQRLLGLQDQLETHPDVGTLLSMPLLVEEARRSSSWSFLFSNQTLLKWMASEKYDSIAKGFITDDQKSALLFFRMNEEGRAKHRLEVVAEIKALIEKKGFDPYLTGGVYALQGNLSRHVAVSLIYGLGQLLFVFLIIAFIASLKIRTALAMSFAIGMIPLCILGVVGALGLPMDTIAAPAANIAISMGIDAMLHMVNASRRFLETRNRRRRAVAQGARTHVGAGHDLDVHRCQRLRDIFLLVVPAHPALRRVHRAGHGHFRVLRHIYIFSSGPAAD